MPYQVKIDPTANSGQATVIPDATQKTAGVMSAADKQALDNLVKFSRGGVVDVTSSEVEVNITFEPEYPPGYVYQFFATASPDDPLAPIVLCDVVNRTNTGMTIRPSVPIDGAISWSTK